MSTLVLKCFGTNALMFCQALLRVDATHWKKVSMGYRDALNGDTSRVVENELSWYWYCSNKNFRVDIKKQREKNDVNNDIQYQSKDKFHWHYLLKKSIIVLRFCNE